MARETQTNPEEVINDPGNEDPGSVLEDAEVPLNDLDDAADVGNTQLDD